MSFSTSLKKVAMFPIYWVPQRVGRATSRKSKPPFVGGFQFIGFPSEWGEEASVSNNSCPRVSNLLGSPASGEFDKGIPEAVDFLRVSNLLGSPASGEPKGLLLPASVVSF